MSSDMRYMRTGGYGFGAGKWNHRSASGFLGGTGK